MTAVIALFAVLGMPFQQEWLTVPDPPEPQMHCYVGVVWPFDDQGGEPQQVRICMMEER